MMSAVQATPSRHKLSGFAGFTLVSLVLIGVAAFALTLVFRTPGDSQAVWISAAVAWITQVAAFPAVKRMTSVNLMTGWGLGSIVRLGTLLIYALVAALVLKLSMTPALVGLALFYFVSMVIEPLFLRS
jgi:hypothetical protein